MPLLDCAALLKESKASKTKVLAEAFVKHAIPMIDVAKLQEAFIQQIKTSSKPELPIFAYKTTEITVDGSEAAEGNLSGQTVASVAYEFCDKLPCGTPIGKAVSGWAACELLGAVLGPNIHVSKRFKSRVEDHPQWLGYTCDIVASFQEKPVKRSATGLAWWPEAFLNELITKMACHEGTTFDEEGGNDVMPVYRKCPCYICRLKKEATSDDGATRIVWTRGADGMMRCPNGGINLEDARTNMLWQTGLPPELVPGPPLERVGTGEPVISGLARRLFSMPRSTAPHAASTVELPTMARPFLPLECLGAGLNPEERRGRAPFCFS